MLKKASNSPLGEVVSRTKRPALTECIIVIWGTVMMELRKSIGLGLIFSYRTSLDSFLAYS